MSGIEFKENKVDQNQENFKKDKEPNIQQLDKRINDDYDQEVIYNNE